MSAGEGQEIFGLGGDFDYPEDYVAPASGVEVEDDTVPVTTATAIDFGDDLLVTDDGLGHVTVDSTAVTDAELAAHEGDVSTHGVVEVAGIADITFETLDAAGDVGTGASQLAEGDHTHPGGGTTIDVEEDNAAVGAAGTLDFGAGLDVSFAAGEADVSVDLSEVSAFTDHSARHENGGADEISIAGLDGTPVELTNHLNDVADAHDASAISVDSTTLSGTGTDVQASLEELDNLLDDHSARHENGGADEISIAGLDGTPVELTNHLNDAADAHDASAISILDAAADFDATDVEGALAELQSDAEAHVAAGDPHTGYRLESADHPHTSTGLNGGQLDHGAALTGLTDDDHTQYLKETDVAAKGDIYAASANDTVGVLSVGSNGQKLTPKSGDALGVAWVDDEFTVGGVILNPTSGLSIIAWRAPFACTVTAVHAQVDTGTTTVVNAGKGFAGGTTEFCSADITIDPADAWEAGTVDQNSTLVAGDAVYLEVVTAGTAAQVTIQVTLKRTA